MSFDKKHSPENLNEVVFENDAVQKRILTYYTGRRTNLLLYGPPGTGKTTIARLIPKAVAPDVQRPEILFRNCANVRSVNAIESIETFATLGCFNSACLRFVILDEVDRLPDMAMAALRDVIDRTSAFCLFLMTTNNYHLIPDYMLSRWLKIQIKQAHPVRWIPRALSIMQRENCPATEEILRPVLNQKHVDHRDIMRALEDLVLDVQQSQMPANTVACIVPTQPVATPATPSSSTQANT